MPRIMLIEDDDRLRNLIRLHLSRAGITVQACENAATGLKQILQVRPDLLVLDLLLPDMNGLQVLQALRGEAITKDLPVVVLTAKKDIDTISNARRFGANAYLIKPVRLDKLTKTILEELSRVASSET